MPMPNESIIYAASTKNKTKIIEQMNAAQEQQKKQQQAQADLEVKPQNMKMML